MLPSTTELSPVHGQDTDTERRGISETQTAACPAGPPTCTLSRVHSLPCRGPCQLLFCVSFKHGLCTFRRAVPCQALLLLRAPPTSPPRHTPRALG